MRATLCLRLPHNLTRGDLMTSHPIQTHLCEWAWNSKKDRTRAKASGFNSETRLQPLVSHCQHSWNNFSVSVPWC